MSRKAIYLLCIALELGWLAANPAHRRFLWDKISEPIGLIATRREYDRLETRIGEEMRLSRSGNAAAIAKVANYMLRPQTLPPEVRRRVGLMVARPADGMELLRRASSRGDSRARFRIWKEARGSTLALRNIVESWHGPGIYEAAAELARRALARCDRASIGIALVALESAEHTKRQRLDPNSSGIVPGETEATRRGFQAECSDD